MSTLWYAMHIPLALVAGAAVASNPRWFPVEAVPYHVSGSSELSPVEAVRAREKERDKVPAPGRLGAESPELRALRLAEDQLFAELEQEGISFETPEDIQAFASSSDFLDGLNEPSFPVARHDAVRRYVNFFSESPKGREMFGTWLKRSGRYRAIISKALREKGLPSDLEAIVFVESGFWPTAKSGAGAAGLWQFMPATARAYGLTVSSTYDERRNPWRSSEAAAAHLSDLYARFKSWDLALAAYNFGYQNVESRLSEADVQDFWSIVDEEGILPEETRRYVPKIHAVAVLLNNLDHYGFDAADLDESLRAAAFEVPPGTSLTSLARAAGTSQTNIKQLNPEFLTDLAPDRGSPVVVHLPRTSLARARVMLPRLLGGDMREIEGDDSLFFDHGASDLGQTRLKDTVVSRAEQRRQVDDLDHQRAKYEPAEEMPAEEIPERAAAEPVTKVAPSKKAESVSRSEPEVLHSEEITMSSAATERASRESALTLAFIRYRVSRGDSLSDLAGRFGVSERELILDNGIRNPEVIFRGQELKIRDAKQTPERDTMDYKVRRGDSLGRIAKRHAESPQRLAELNNIKDPSHIEVGQIVRIPPNPAAATGKL